MAPPCGVPSARLPLSSSMARKTRKRPPVMQPSDVQVVPETLHWKAELVAVERDRYQRRSTVDHAEPEPGLGMSRAARSHSACDDPIDSQWASLFFVVRTRARASLPQGPT